MYSVRKSGDFVDLLPGHLACDRSTQGSGPREMKAVWREEADGAAG